MTQTELPAPDAHPAPSRAVGSVTRPGGPGAVLRRLRPRWRKIARDIALQRARTVLAVASIAVGVFALAVILGTRTILQRDLADAFQSIRPSNATIQSLQPLPDNLVRSVERIPGVAEAEGRQSVAVRLKDPQGEWKNLQLISVPDYDDIRIDKIRPHEGPWPPPEREMLVERSALRLVGAEVGDYVTVKAPGRRERSIRVAGTAHDLYALLYTLDGLPWAYVSQDTMAWLGEPDGITELRFVVDDAAAMGRQRVAAPSTSPTTTAPTFPPPSGPPSPWTAGSTASTTSSRTAKGARCPSRRSTTSR